MMTSQQIQYGDGRHIDNRLLAISQRVIIRLTRNFVG